jgi:Fur family peroxide stress response transcriptional regulator
MAAPKKRFDEMVAKLKEHGYRLTPQRMAVLKALADSDDHPTIEKIFKRVKPDFSSTSLATIYKTVTLLKELGEVYELSLSEGNRYDAMKPFPHPHLICVNCDTVTDVDIDHLADLAAEMSRKTGYRILNQRVDFFGICTDCQAE